MVMYTVNFVLNDGALILCDGRGDFMKNGETMIGALTIRCTMWSSLSFSLNFNFSTEKQFLMRFKNEEQAVTFSMCRLLRSLNYGQAHCS